jgi:hypothetical protein
MPAHLQHLVDAATQNDCATSIPARHTPVPVLSRCVNPTASAGLRQPQTAADHHIACTIVVHRRHRLRQKTIKVEQPVSPRKHRITLANTRFEHPY